MPTIYQRGAFWRAMVRRRGESISRTFDTKEEAEAWAAETEDRILAGLGAKPKRPKRDMATYTVSELFNRYADEVSPDKGGARWEVIRLKSLSTAFPCLAVEIDSAAVAEWRDARMKQVKASTVNRELNLISAVLTRAIKEWRLPIAVNPVHQIQRPKHPHARRRRVSDDERVVIIKALGWDEKSEPVGIRQWIAWGFCLALETMMRQGEILRLTWEHIHLDRKFCHLPTTKNGHPRDVPLSSRALALFALLKPRPGTQRVVLVASGTFGAYFREATTSAGIKDLHFHDTRREALTRASKKLSNVAELARASGHRGVGSLMVYYEPDPTELADKLG